MSEVKVTDGFRIYDHDWLLSTGHECYAHEGGVLAIWSPEKRKHVAINPIGMTQDEINRAVTAGDTLLCRAEAAPVNRAARRAIGTH